MNEEGIVRFEAELFKWQETMMLKLREGIVLEADEDALERVEQIVATGSSILKPVNHSVLKCYLCGEIIMGQHECNAPSQLRRYARLVGKVHRLLTSLQNTIQVFKVES